jgi:thiamine biosynthesis lipoprotein ApbE
MNIATILGTAVENFQSKLTDGKFQPTVAEYLKLVQIEQEYEKDLNPPEEIQVTWVEPTTES